MADACDGVPWHDFEPVLCEPIDGVPRIIDCQSGQPWIGSVFIDPHAVVEVLIGRVGYAQPLLKDGSCTGDLASRPKQSSPKGRTFLYQQNPCAAHCSE